MKPWRPKIPPDQSQSNDALQFGHGDEAVETFPTGNLSVPVRRRFNSATAMKPWRPYPRCFGHSRKTWLQFGHGDEAVETCACPWVLPRHNAGFNSATAMKPWRRLGHWIEPCAMASA